MAISLVLTILSCSLSVDKHISEASKERKGVIVQKLDSIGRHFINTGKVNGISLAVCTRKDTLYNKGFGYTDSLKRTQVENDDLFLLASVSKLVGATVVMKLVDEGKLSLDNTLFELLPDFPNQDQARDITLRHLLSHTSGLLDYAMEIDDRYLQTGIDPTRDDFYSFFARQELFFEPGEFYSYSNSGFLLMAMIIERLTGNSFQQEIDRVINQPTGLSIRLIAECIHDPKLSGYFELLDSTLVNRPHWLWIKGDGGLTSSAIDLARFPFYWSDGTLISNNSFEEMIAPVVLNNGVTTGYGTGVRTGTFEGEKVIGHTGGDKSTFAMMMYLPERDISIVVMVNTDNTPSDALMIIGPVALAVLGKEAPRLDHLQTTGGSLSKYEGLYLTHEEKNRDFDSLLIYLNAEDNHLYMKPKGSDGNGVKYYYLGNHVFANERYPMDRSVFELNKKGEVVAFRNYWNGLFQQMGFRDHLFEGQ